MIYRLIDFALNLNLNLNLNFNLDLPERSEGS